MKVYLARHGQTTGDIEDRYGGDYDDHLTELGQNQARELGRKLSSKGIEAIFTSPRIRAQETAALVAEALQVPVEVKEAIRERNHYGVLTGLTKTEAKAKYPELVELVKDRLNTVTGAEDFKAFQNRVIAAWQELASLPYKTIAVVSHGGPIRVIIRDFLQFGDIEIEDCAFAEIEKAGDEFRILSLEGIKRK